MLLRLKEDYDGAEPAASSVATLNALTSAHLTGDSSALARAERTLARYGPRIGGAARVVPMMLSALSAWHGGHLQAVVVADSREAQRDLLSALATLYVPFAIVVPVVSGASQQALAARLPFLEAMRPVGGHATAYVCRNFTCRQPVTTAGQLRGELTREGNR